MAMAARASGFTRRIPVENEHGEPTGWVLFDGLIDFVKVEGRVYVPAEYHLRFPGDDRQPALTVTFNIRDGGPVCTGVELEAKRGGRRVQPKDLNVVSAKLASWTEAALKIVMTVGESDGTTLRLSSDVDARTAGKAAAAARKRANQKMTDSLLREVAALYQDNEGADPYGALRQRFGKGDSTLFRYVKLAREAGFLNETTTRGKKK